MKTIVCCDVIPLSRDAKRRWSHHGGNFAVATRLISDLPLRFYELICGPRSIVDPIDGPQILSKLHWILIWWWSRWERRKDNAYLHISQAILLRILDPCLTYAECNGISSRIHAECSVHCPLQGGARFRFK